MLLSYLALLYITSTASFSQRDLADSFDLDYYHTLIKLFDQVKRFIDRMISINLSSSFSSLDAQLLSEGYASSNPSYTNLYLRFT